MNRKYKSDAFQAIHEDAVANFEIGAISEKEMKEYDEACLKKEALAEHSAVRKAARPAGAGVYASGR